MDNIKKVAITGAAINDYMSRGKKTRRGKRAMQGGYDEESMNEPVKMSNSPAAGAATLNIVKTGNNSAAPVPPATAPAAAATAPTIQTNQQGGKPKIVLAPKQKTKKVLLAPKHQQKIHLPHKKQNKHTIRRVCLPVNVIKTKIAKTRKHIKDSQSMSIDKIRKELIESKLLNPASKAPDALLRKIYADVKIIGNN
jgi:hypothetical protein